MSQKLDTRAFIERARAVHGERYDYSKVEYKTGEDSVTIGCALHGYFEQRAATHIKARASGCAKCGDLSTRASKVKNLAWFIERARAVQGERYDYSKVEYYNTARKVAIVCPIHGVFTQVVSSHLSGCGCNACGNQDIGRKLADTFSDFLFKAKEVHGNKYSYANTNFTNYANKVEIYCPAHGAFIISPKLHIFNKRGCQKCGRQRQVENSGWSLSAWAERQNGRKAILYVIEIFGNEESFYKVGITYNLQARFNPRTIAYGWRTVALFKSYDARKVYNLEKDIHRRFKHLRYEPKISFHGETECYYSATEILASLPTESFFLKNRPVT